MTGQTPSQTVGPFFHIALDREGENVMATEKTRGAPITIRGRVLDGDGNAVPDALVELWQADAGGVFDHPADPRRAGADPAFRGFGRAATDDNGAFWFRTVKPGCVPWDDARQQAPHVNVRVFSRGMLVHAVTRCYFADERSNAEDPLLSAVADPARRQTLIASLEETADVPAYRFDIRLQGQGETVFLDV